MNRRLAYAFILVGFFVTGGTFGLAAAAPHTQTEIPATVPPVEATVVVPQVTNAAGVPVTGEPEPVLTEILVFYGLIGVTALFLILALLNFASKPTAPYTHPKGRSSDDVPGH
ncbi:MAG TPA: hypothetical protein VGK56_02005 [Anaerolineales bacterium]